MNLNSLAVAISKREGKKVQVNIAQIKEILRITIDLLNEVGFPDPELIVAKKLKKKDVPWVNVKHCDDWFTKKKKPKVKK